MRLEDKEREKLREVKTFNEFIEALKNIGLVIADLWKYGTATKYYWNNLRKNFRGKENNKKEWAKFKECSYAYYCWTQMHPDIAWSNKQRETANAQST